MRFNLNSELVLFYRISREGNGAYTDDELSELNDPFVKMLGEKARTAKQRKAFAARERRNMADAVRELAERLHLDNVEIVTDPMEVKDRRGKVHHPKGFYNTKTGKITVIIPNHATSRTLFRRCCMRLLLITVCVSCLASTSTRS